LIILILSSFVYSGNYELELNQIKKRVLVKETINGTKQTEYFGEGIIEKSFYNYYLIKKLYFQKILKMLK
jgi:hypothetical protein